MSLKVLVIDDSAYNRQVISDILNSHPDIEVVGKADDGEQGLKWAASLQPDLITLDIEMPRMDGFTFLRVLMSRMPTPVIVISSHSRKQEVFQALELGALDFIAKPERYLPPESDRLRDDILRKTLAVKALQVVPFRNRTSKAEPTVASASSAQPTQRTTQPDAASLERLVAIGASTGGPPALQSLFKTIDAAPNTAFFVTQHMPEKFTRAFADRLNRVSSLDVLEAEDGMSVEAGVVHVAPGGMHMRVVAESGLHVRLEPSSPEDRYVPSIDRMLTSVAELRRLDTMGVILTGMGADGASGIREIFASGGLCVAESQESAIVFGMPKEAIRTSCIHEVLHLEEIIGRIHRFVGARNADSA